MHTQSIQNIQDILDITFTRTEAGDAELLRSGRLERRQMVVLSLIDGSFASRDIAEHLRTFDVAGVLGELERGGLIARADTAPRRAGMGGHSRLGQTARRHDVGSEIRSFLTAAFMPLGSDSALVTLAHEASNDADAALAFGGRLGSYLENPQLLAEAATAALASVAPMVGAVDTPLASRLQAYLRAALDEQEITGLTGSPTPTAG